VEKLSVDIQNLPNQFGELLAQTQPGHEIIVTEGGQPKAILALIAPPTTPVEPEGWEELTVTFAGEPRTIRVPIYPRPAQAKPRVPGLGVGKIEILPGFNDPLPDEFWLGEP